jgi:PadR family transcriptional regulator PadR
MLDDSPPGGSPARSQFTASPPRRFVYPALLLLLAEQPRHGYLLAEGLRELGLGQVDRHSVYRTLGDLAADGLVLSWDEPPAAGTVRHVYALTDRGVQVLEGWMSVVAAERARLDLVLRRFWYCNAHTLQSPAGEAMPGDFEPAAPPARPQRIEFEVAGDRSCLTVEARSSLGPIAFSTGRLRGRVSARIEGGLVSVEEPPQAYLEVELDSLQSGNQLYDGELLRRVDARRHPIVKLELRRVERFGEGNCYEAGGDLTLRGTTQTIQGSVTATLREDRRPAPRGPEVIERCLTIAGEHILDIREWGIAQPSMPVFKIYPDVRLRLHLEADSVATAS